MVRCLARVAGVLSLFFCCIQFLFAQDSLPADDWKSRLGDQVNQTGTITLFRISGSNTIGAHLAPALLQAFFLAEGFTDVRVEPRGENESEVSAIWSGAERPVRVAVKLAAHGSSTGFRALALGDAELAASSRPIKADEQRQLARLGDLTDGEHEHIIAIDGLAIIVHPQNPLVKLSTRQITDLFTGKISDWREVGGASAPVRIYARDGASGTYDTFERLVLQGAVLSRQALRFESNDLLAHSVLADVNGIGFVPLANLGAAKALQVSDGVALGLAPTLLSVATEDYPLSRRLYFYGAGEGESAGPVAAFLRFVVADAGQHQVEASGFVAQALHGVNVEAADARLLHWQRLNLNIRFADGSSELDNKARADVARLAAFLEQNQHKKLRLTLVGYSNPATLRNQSTLSRLRAQNVRWALREQGVQGALETLAGDAVAVADPHSLNADRNRRVELWLQ